MKPKGLIVSTHLNFGPCALVAHLALRSRYFLVAHGIDVHDGLSNFRIKALRNSSKIIAVSEWTRRRVLNLGGIQDHQVSVLPNTFDDSRFTPGPRPPSLAHRYRIRSDERVILTVARLDINEGYKGYDRVLEALPRIIEALGSVRYIICGKGQDSHRIQQIAERLGMSDHVTLAGFVSEEELADHYRLADVFAMPSTGEGFGIVFLEAMGCGTPVLGGDQDGSVDALDQGRLGLLVDPYSVPAIADGIISLLNKRGAPFWFQPELLSAEVKKSYGRQAFRKRVAEIFDVSDMAVDVTPHPTEHV